MSPRRRQPELYARPVGSIPDRYERGLDAYSSQFGIPREEVAVWFAERFGERFAEEAINTAGAAWPAEDVLSLRDRSLIVVAALIAQGGVENRLRSHVRWAIEHGSTREELDAVGRCWRFIAVSRAHPPAWRSSARNSPASISKTTDRRSARGNPLERDHDRGARRSAPIRVPKWILYESQRHGAAASSRDKVRVPCRPELVPTFGPITRVPRQVSSSVSQRSIPQRDHEGFRVAHPAYGSGMRVHRSGPDT